MNELLITSMSIAHHYKIDYKQNCLHMEARCCHKKVTARQVSGGRKKLSSYHQVKKKLHRILL